MIENKLEKLVLPESRSERIKRLEDTKNTLKTEFIGLDSIVDEIIKDISPWYITPEIIERPVIISLFGMSGTGKTSVVRRLVELLGLMSRSIFFDCGEENNESSGFNTISDKIFESFGIDGESNPDKVPQNTVFVFDEFQYARTINESGEEIVKPTLRPVWNIIDSGLISVGGYRYDINHFNSFLEDFSVFAKEHPDMKLVNGKVEDSEDVRTLLLSLGLFYYDRNIDRLLKDKEGNKPLKNCIDKEDDFENEEDLLDPITVLDKSCLRAILKKFNSFGPYAGANKIKELNSLGTISELYSALKSIKNVVTSSRPLDCSGSLVFIIGNLDEAFHVQSDLSPDVDADTFYYQTSSVSISDIKEALKLRFRAEQIARFGNNLIKYPTLRKDDFKKIIEKELKRIIGKFKDKEGINVGISQGIKELLYFEGVFPSQGVRPVFTTIGSFFTPLLSDILVEKEKKNADLGDVLIRLSGEDEGKDISFCRDSIEIILEFPKTGHKIEKTIQLQLGPLRDPGRRLTRYCNAVHEAGHAIVSLYETGEYPVNVVAVSSGDGGFCDTYNKKKEGEIMTRREIDSEVKVLMAGYMAEELVFKIPGERLMGSSSDITQAWYTFSSAAYKIGYFEPYCFSSIHNEGGGDGTPRGIKDDFINVKSPYNRTRTFGSLKDAVAIRFEELINETKRILETERRLLKYLALELGKRGSLGKEDIEVIVKQWGNELNIEEHISWRRKLSSGEYYLDALKEF